MNDTLLDKALKRKGELQAELAEVERIITFYEARGNSEHRKQVSSPILKGKAGQKRRGLPAQIGKAAEAVLIARGKPMTRGEIASVLIKQGFELPLTDPSKYVGTILWRQSIKFENREGEGYWLRGRRITKS